MIIESLPDIEFSRYIAKIYVRSLSNKYKKNLSRFQSDYKGTIIGESGERAALDELRFFSDQMKILTNIRLEVNGQSIESDIICICPQGIFVLEVKNLGSTGSYNIVVEKDGLWKKVMKNGRWKAMGSVSKQNVRHLHGIEQVVNSKMKNSLEHWITARSIIVFANDVVGIRNYSENAIVRATEIMNEVRKYPTNLNEKQIDQIADILQNESLPPKKYETENWAQLIVGLRLEIIERANQLLTSIKPCLDIVNTYTKIPNYRELFEFKVNDESFDISLEDNISDYHKSDAEIAREAGQAGKQTGERKMQETYEEDEEIYYEEQSSVYGADGDPFDPGSTNYFYSFEKGDGWYDPFWEKK